MASKKGTGKKKSSNKLFIFIFIVFFLGCIGMIDYPYVARYINDQIQGNVVTDYDSSVSSATNIEKLLKDAKSYNKSLFSGVLGDPFSVDNKEDNTYKSLLSVDSSGVMGTIEIPSISVKLPIYHGTSEDTLQKGAGHLFGSSLPVGGKGTHSCISAHRGLPDKKMFTNLDLLKKDDIFYIHVLDKTLEYKIFEIETVLPTNVEPLQIQDGKDLVTLITCTPYGINSHRLYVHAKRVPLDSVEEAEVVQQDESNPLTLKAWLVMYWWIPVTILMLELLLFIVLAILT